MQEKMAFSHETLALGMEYPNPIADNAGFLSAYQGLV